MTPEAARWEAWLSGLSAVERACVERVWAHVVSGYGAAPPLPIVGRGEGYLYFGWSGARHYCDVEHDGERYDWFYRDRLAEEVQGDEGVDVLPDRFFEYLRLAAADLEGRLG